MVSRRVAAMYVAFAVIMSCVLTFTVGTVYLDRRIQKGIEDSRVIDARVDAAFGGLCDLLLLSARPFPRPPVAGPAQPSPETPFGKELAKYNAAVAQRQAEGQVALKQAINRYHC